MNTIDRDLLVQSLKQGEVIVTFTKRDGTDRTMVCTLMEGKVVPHEKKTDRVKEKNDDVLPVWDVEENAWRSFKLSTIKSVSIELNQ